MDTSIFGKNYRLLESLGIIRDGKSFTYGKSKAGDYLDLVAQRHSAYPNRQLNSYSVSISHEYQSNLGTIRNEPEFVIAVYPEIHEAEVLEYNITSLKHEKIYPSPSKTNHRLKKKLNEEFNLWLKHLIDEGHGKKWFDLDGVPLI